MTHKERVLTAVRHRQPDRPPLFYRDVPEVDARLQKDLGLRSREELLRRFDVDFRWVGARYIGPPLTDEAAGSVRDIWGASSRYVAAEHGGNWERVDFPLAAIEDPAALKDYPWPRVEWFDFSVLEAQVEAYRDYAIMTAPGIDSPSFTGALQSLVGIERSMTDMLLHPEFLEALLGPITEFYVAYFERFFAVAGRRIDFFRIGDDLGTQRSPLMREAHARRFLQPAIQAVTAIARRHGARYYHHSCGAVRPLIPFFIEIGVDVLDPLQVKAEGMVPAELKAEYGDRLCFSGGVDEQELLPRGTPEDVRRGTRELLDVMAPGGGFFLGPTHNLQPDIPTANVVAMYEAAREWTYR